MKWCMNIGAIAEVTGGEMRNVSGDEIVKNVVRDDREVTEGTVFVALNGENNNGHRFVPRARKTAQCAALWTRARASSPACLLWRLRIPTRLWGI